MDQEIVLKMSKKRALGGLALAFFGGGAGLIIMLLGFQIIPNDMHFRAHRLFWLSPFLLIFSLVLIPIGLMGLGRSLVLGLGGSASLLINGVKVESIEFPEDDERSLVFKCLSRTKTKTPAFNVFLMDKGQIQRKLISAAALTAEQLNLLAYPHFIRFEGLERIELG